MGHMFREKAKEKKKRERESETLYQSETTKELPPFVITRKKSGLAERYDRLTSSFGLDSGWSR